MDTLTLPQPIAACFVAEHNPEALAHGFTAQADRARIASLEITA